MSDNLNAAYVDSTTNRMFKDPLEAARAWHAELLKESAANEIAYESSVATQVGAQEAAAEGYEQQGDELFGMMTEVAGAIEDIGVQEKYNAAMHDEKSRQAFGEWAGPEIPKSIGAAERLYGDTLYAQYIADDFDKYVGEDTREALRNRSRAAREALAEAYKSTLGATSAEAQDNINKRFAAAEAKVFRNRMWEKAKDAPLGAAGTVLKALEKFGIIDMPLRQAGLEFENVMAMDPEQLKERYPAEAAALARALLLDNREELTTEEKKELGDLKRVLRAVMPNIGKQAIAVQRGIIEALKEGKRIIKGDPYNPRVVKEFVNNVTDNPKLQKILEPIIEVSSIFPIIAAERTAIKTALSLPAHAYRAGATNSAIGRIADIVVPGRPSAWSVASDISYTAVAASARNAVRSKIATAGDIDDSARLFGGEFQASELKMYEDSAEKFGGSQKSFLNKYNKHYSEAVWRILNGDFSDEAIRRAGADTLRRIRRSANPNPEDLKVAEVLESQLKQADAQATREAGKSVPLEYASDLASENVLDRLGYSDELLRSLIKTDDEAKRFHELYEEAKVKAGDAETAKYYADVKKGKQWGAVLEGTRAEQEDRAMLYALVKFSQETGRSFRDVDIEHFTPGSFAEFVPELEVLALRREPNRYLTGVEPAPEEVRVLFQKVGTSRSFTEIVGHLKAQVDEAFRAQVQGGTPHMTPARLVPMLDDNGAEFIGVHSEDFIEMGEIFRVPVEDLSEEAQLIGPLESYKKQVYNAFRDRFGATKGEIATGKTLYDDMTPELKELGHPAQVAKVEEIVNTWRSLKWLMRQAAGTDMEENAVNLALWYRSQIANGGTTYRLIHARTESFNRAARGQANGTTFARPTDYRATELPDKTYLRGEGGLLRSALDPEAGTVKTKLEASEERSGQVWSGLPSSEIKHRRVPPGQKHGAEGPDVTAADADDAMARVEQLSSLMRDSDDAYGMGQMEQWKVAARQKERDAAKMQPVPEGPVPSATTHSLEGTYEDLYVLDLEEFAGIGATRETIASNFRVNVFHAGPDELMETLANYTPANLEKLYRTVVDEQIASMANRIATQGAYQEQLVLYHRALATAKGIREIRETGKISAATETWLREMDLRAGAVGATNEEAIVAGIEAAAKRYGFAIEKTKAGQKVLDIRSAELYELATTTAAREKFIDDYAKMMTGEEMVRMKREYNQGLKIIRNEIKACL